MITSVVSGSLAAASDPPTIAGAGVYQYFPSAPNDSYVDVTVPPKEAGATLPNVVSIIIPQRATSGPSTFIFTSFSSNVETDNGFFVVKCHFLTQMQLLSHLFREVMRLDFIRLIAALHFTGRTMGRHGRKSPSQPKSFFPLDYIPYLFMNGMIVILSSLIN
jgi:hypothetical protein